MTINYVLYLLIDRIILAKVSAIVGAFLSLPFIRWFMALQ